MELGHRAEIVSQTVLFVERKEGGIERGSQILWGRLGGGESAHATLRPYTRPALVEGGLYGGRYFRMHEHQIPKCRLRRCSMAWCYVGLCECI